jgi:HlyD family secretion protein
VKAVTHMADRGRPALWFAIALFTACAAMLLWLARGRGEPGQVVSIRSIELATVTRGSIVDEVIAQGSVIAAVSPTLYSAAAGTIAYLVHAGDRVSKGQVLARISSPDLDNEYERERTTLASMDAQFAQGRIELQQQLFTNEEQANLAAVTMNAELRDLERSQQAWNLRVISARDYEAALDSFTIARLEFEHARWNSALEQKRILLGLRTRELMRESQSLLVSGLRHRIDELTVRSPVDGLVAELGQPDQTHVARNVPLVRVVDLTALAIRFQVAESLADGIRPGLPARITLDDQTANGLVTAVSPDVQQGWVTGRARFVGSQPFGMRQNEQAQLRIALRRRDDVLEVERGAFLRPESPYVYVLHGDHIVRARVQLKAASVSEIEVMRGLAAGDQIVISATSPFDDASQIRVTR